MFENFLAKMAGKLAAQKLKLQEGPTMPSKPWYTSKGMWAGIVGILMGIVGFVDVNFTHGAIASSPYFSMAVAFLGAMGLYSRGTATTTISK